MKQIVAETFIPKIEGKCEKNTIYHNYLWKYYEGVETK